ncbi:hypothetical protein JXA27_06685 [Aerococcaceae bacterium zg-B36]|uniref:hypothetical protein n=1 Tax=Aerococcaceae bacterium zg-252 TaxID=2796928 RepID=UPI001BD8FD2A|nr:hypothetical protein [Aerococcaceae bacterium zg-B36]
MTPTHILNLKLSVDCLPLIDPNNIEGAKVALGTSDDSKVIELFANNVLNQIKETVSRFSNIGIYEAEIARVTYESNSEESQQYTPEDNNEEEIHEVFEPDIEYEPNYNLDKEVSIVERLNRVRDEIISDGGSIDSIVFKNDDLRRSFIDKETWSIFEITVQEDLDTDYWVNYKDADGKELEVGGNV